jgi:amino acid transporter/nucleotide-binding universal stress UspA family protein
VADKPPSLVTGELSRDLNLFHITMMGLGMMIGAGVFVGIGLSIKGAGPGGLLVTMALNGLIALFSAMSFAELSSAIPRAGGAYNFARIGFGRGTSFIAGWIEWMAAAAAGGFYAVVFATFTVRFVAPIAGWVPAEGADAAALAAYATREMIAIRATAVIAAAFFIYINYRGASETGKLGALFTIGQMVFVLAIGVAGLFVIARHPERIQNFTPFLKDGNWFHLLGTMGVIYVAFEGFEVIAQAGDETIEPKRNIPKAMLYSVMIVTLTYVLVAFASVVAIRLDGDETVVSFFSRYEDIDGFKRSVQELVSPGIGSLLVTLAVIFSATSALNATIYSATRACYALGRDGMLPALVATIGAKRRTPHVALGLTSVIVAAVALTLAPKDCSAMASIMFLFLFFLVNLCAIRIRYNMGDELEYGYLMPLFPLFPVLAIVCQTALCWGIFEESMLAWAIACLWVPLGLAVYFSYGRKHAPAMDYDIHILDTHEAPTGDEYRIMVSVANPNNALQLVRNTYRLCGAKEARVELLHMVPVPDQVPLGDAQKYAWAGKEAIVEIMLYLAPLFPISTHLRYCRNVGRGIISAVRQRRANLLVLGWHGKARGGVFRLGSTIDPVIERSPCNVAVLKGCGGDQTYRRVLVPVAGGPNGEFALEIAGILAEPEDSEIVVFHVGRRNSKFDPAAFILRNEDRLRVPTERVHAKVVVADDVVDAVLSEAADYDLVVLGCTREPLLQQWVRTTIPEQVAQACDKPLVMVKATTGLRGWLRRWI